ncbi:hypothetical protein DEI97_013525 [Curtobacterium sp. MCLR17_032]|uniref:hypothetical protein n=1 Tax=Curtobacterium sp. MCLR17_032 TaxID=2175650 RepID=UPI000DAA5D52|nr:hypothetical protein [Curtobacterium sp. MCLR17_032]WIE60761.1 hypothetical protein DEI97_013525 [Curtobacterium sp. MCLR17_032]
MTALTSKEMRVVADDLQRGNSGRFRSEVIAEAETALRTAADQLEAVQEAYEDFAPWCVGFFGRNEKWPDGVEQHLRDLRIALTADTTPQDAP